MTWISVDPGEDTGWALWDGADLLDAGTMEGWEFIDWLDGHGVDNWRGDGSKPWQFIDKFVVEDWIVYPWSVEALIWNRQRTVRIIGAIELLARQGSIELVYQPAKIKEAAEAGGAEAYFLRPLHPNRHANDAIRHGIWHLQTTKAGAGALNRPEAAKRAPEQPGAPSRGKNAQGKPS